MKNDFAGVITFENYADRRLAGVHDQRSDILSAIKLMAWKTDASGLTDQTWRPLCRRIELTGSAMCLHP